MVGSSIIGTGNTGSTETDTLVEAHHPRCARPPEKLDCDIRTESEDDPTTLISILSRCVITSTEESTPSIEYIRKEVAGM